jgi:alpha-N-acetylglucosamine transferase
MKKKCFIIFQIFCFTIVFYYYYFVKNDSKGLRNLLIEAKSSYEEQQRKSDPIKIEGFEEILKHQKIDIEVKNVYLSSCKNRVKQNYKKSIWTFLSDTDGYFISAIKLIKSIRAHTSIYDYDSFILEIKEKPLDESLKQILRSNGWEICQVDRIAPRDEANTHPPFRDQFTKLILWNMTEYNAIYYFDSDSFVIKNIDSYLNIHKKFNSSIKIGASRDFHPIGWVSTFNMGVFVIKPNKQEFHKLIQLKSDPNFVFETIMSEQGFLNQAYKDQWYEIGFENNANLAVYTQKPDFWKKMANKINVIHFTMNKPWICDSVHKLICKYWQIID